MTTATWVSQDVQLGSSAPGGSADTTITSTSGNTTYGPPVGIGTIKRFFDSTGKYGAGQFIYLPGVSGLNVGDVVQYHLSDGNSAVTGSVVVRWAGTANTGEPLAVATTANTSATNFSWYQVQGAAVVNCSGTVAAGNAAYFANTAIVSTTVAGGKQVLGMRAASANGAAGLTNVQAVYDLDFPCVQSQIT